MAITGIEYTVLRFLREQNALPLGVDLLELGEANWYGDVALEAFQRDIGLFAREADRASLLQWLGDVIRQLQTPLEASQRAALMFALPKVHYRTFFHARSIVSIDLNGTSQALRLDLNTPIDLGRRFGVVLNIGTAEHVFNQFQVFKTMHDHALAGGLMVHVLPFTGWIDHGFYNFQPTFFWDLAAANRYEVVLMLCGEIAPLKLTQLHNRESIIDLAGRQAIGQNVNLLVALRKPHDEAFVVPMQGFYSEQLSARSAAAWKNMR
ncbi:MAG: hypothetical protein HQL96_17320 [Magnetococcales bacterium]|nr:hypothetical protein [Magnetococcales bacterium]